MKTMPSASRKFAKLILRIRRCRRKTAAMSIWTPCRLWRAKPPTRHRNTQYLIGTHLGSLIRPPLVIATDMCSRESGLGRGHRRDLAYADHPVLCRSQTAGKNSRLGGKLTFLVLVTADADSVS